MKISAPKALKGAALIEFVIVLPVLLVILAGIVDLSCLLYNKALITNASMQGARYGTVMRNPTYASPASVISYTSAYCNGYLVSFSSTMPSVDVSAVSTATPAHSGDVLTVTVDFTYTYLLLDKFTGSLGEIDISSTTAMMYE